MAYLSPSLFYWSWILAWSHPRLAHYPMMRHTKVDETHREREGFSGERSSSIEEVNGPKSRRTCPIHYPKTTRHLRNKGVCQSGWSGQSKGNRKLHPSGTEWIYGLEWGEGDDNMGVGSMVYASCDWLAQSYSGNMGLASRGMTWLGIRLHHYTIDIAEV